MTLSSWPVSSVNEPMADSMKEFDPMWFSSAPHQSRSSEVRHQSRWQTASQNRRLATRNAMHPRKSGAHTSRLTSSVVANVPIIQVDEGCSGWCPDATGPTYRPLMTSTLDAAGGAPHLTAPPLTARKAFVRW